MANSPVRCKTSWDNWMECSLGRCWKLENHGKPEIGRILYLLSCLEKHQQWISLQACCWYIGLRRSLHIIALVCFLDDERHAWGLALTPPLHPPLASTRQVRRLPSGEHTKSYWKWPFIVDCPIKHGDFPSFFVCLPEDPEGLPRLKSAASGPGSPEGLRPAQALRCGRGMRTAAALCGDLSDLGPGVLAPNKKGHWTSNHGECHRM